MSQSLNHNRIDRFISACLNELGKIAIGLVGGAVAALISFFLRGFLFGWVGFVILLVVSFALGGFLVGVSKWCFAGLGVMLGVPLGAVAIGIYVIKHIPPG